MQLLYLHIIQVAHYLYQQLHLEQLHGEQRVL